MAALCIENTSEFAMNRLFAMEATAAEPQQTQSVEGTEELKQQIEQLKLQLQTQNKVLEDEKTKRAAIEKVGHFCVTVQAAAPGFDVAASFAHTACVHCSAP